MSRFNEYPFIQALDPAATRAGRPDGRAARAVDVLPAADAATSGSRPASASPASRSSTASRSSRCRSAPGSRSTCSASRAWRCRARRRRWCRSSSGCWRASRPTEGVFLIRAQLTENSWLLYREVRLTGGFAFALWWKGPLAGQFVLTIGGYHPSFHRDGYPGRAAARADLAGHRRHRHQGRLVLRPHVRGADGRRGRRGQRRLRLGLGADRLRRRTASSTSTRSGSRSAPTRASRPASRSRPGCGTIRFSISLGATHQGLGPGLQRRGDARGRAVRRHRRLRQRAARCAPRDARLDRVRREVPRGRRRRRGPRAVGDHGQGHAAGGHRWRQSGADARTAPSALPFEVFAEFELTIVTTVPTSAFDLPGGGAGAR